jgi:hypothetical protein
MVQVMVAAGVRLDHAWTRLGGGFGDPLRSWSRDVLVRLIEAAGSRGVEALVIVGDLLDRDTVIPDTVDHAAHALAAFPGPVLIVPGRSDWVGGVGGPYDIDMWQPNTTIWRSADYGPWDVAPDLWISAWTSPAASQPRVPHDANGATLLRASAGDGVGLAVPDLVHEPGEAGGSVLILDTRTRSVETLEIPGQPGQILEVDVSAVESTAELAEAIAAASSTGSAEAVLMRLTGQLAARVLLPGFGGPELPPLTVLDLDSLQFRQLEVEAGDRSAQAEFVRALAGAGTSSMERHQTIALGLVALAETATRA